MCTKPVITLISLGQAQVGRTFIHRGAGSKCNSCEYLHVCVKNLESNRVYKIIRVRNKTLFCKFYDIEMKVVEVKENEILTAISPKQTIKGAIITFKTPECIEDCEKHDVCFPLGIKDSDRCEIVKVNQCFECPHGIRRNLVFLRHVPFS